MRQAEREPEQHRVLQLQDVWRQFDQEGISRVCQNTDSNCSININQAALCVDCDASSRFRGTSEKKGDFVLGTVRRLDGAWWWLLVEMKSGTIRPESIQAQLQSLANQLAVIQQLPMPAPPAVDFLPVVLRGRGRLHPNDQRKLNDLSVVFNGVRRTIVVKACGTQLTDLLKPSSLVQRRQR